MRSLGATILLALEEFAFALVRRPRPAAAPPPGALPAPVTWHLPRDPYGLPN